MTVNKPSSSSNDHSSHFKACFMVHNAVHFFETLKIIKALKPDCHATILLKGFVPTADQMADAEGLVDAFQTMSMLHGRRLHTSKAATQDVAAPNEAPSSAPSPNSVKEALRAFKAGLRRIASNLKNGTSLFYAVEAIYSKIRFRFLLRSNQCDILVLNEANTAFMSELYIQQARKRGIPSLIIPYTFCTPAEPADVYYTVEKYHFDALSDWKQKLIQKRYPQWLYRYKDRDMIRLPFSIMLTQQFLNIESPQPWIQESSTANAIISGSKHETDHHLRNGIPEAQIQEIGIPNQDILYQTLKHKNKVKNDILKQYSFPENERVIVFAVPPNALGLWEQREGFEFDGYDSMIDFWIERLKDFARDNGWRIILSPHPKIESTSLKHHVDEYCVLAEQNSATLVPIADLFVASISTTIKWAIACGVPVINYDVYKFRYDDYGAVEGCITMEEKQDFVTQTQRILFNEEAYQDLLQKQQAQAFYWGILDGKAKQRLLELIHTLIRA